LATAHLPLTGDFQRPNTTSPDISGIPAFGVSRLINLETMVSRRRKGKLENYFQFCEFTSLFDIDFEQI
jgi:hypothetical protein